MKRLPLRLHVNGETVEVLASPAATLLEVLREGLGLTGTKQGCDKGDCGACTVLLDGRPVLACCTLAATVAERPGRPARAVLTIEGLAAGAGGPPGLHPMTLPRAFDEAGALQCGFCQPGVILSAAALLAEDPQPDEARVREAISGNLCRCTGYTKIVEAVRRAAAEPRLGEGGEAGRPPPARVGDPAPGFIAVGARARKPDAIAKATGAAVYADDIRLPRMAVGRILRSTAAHARIRRVDVGPALAMEGVYAAITGRDLPTPYCIIPWTRDETALAVDKVRYVGEGIAAVAARDEETARRALAAIVVELEALPPVLDLDAAEAPDAPLVHERDWKDRPRDSNLCKEVDLRFGEVDADLARGAARVEGTWFYEGSNHAAIEPHCAVADWDADGRLTLWSATQVPHYLHRELARVLDLDPAAVRVVQPTLGGAFGGKSEPFDLEFCAAELARRAGRPVKILYTREEVFYAHRGRHPMEIRLRASADADGRILGVDSDIRLDGGAYHSFGMVTTYYAGQLLTGPTAMNSYRFRARRFYTNKPACGPKRGHGSVQPRFAWECALDELATALGIDPIELRRRNAIPGGSRTVNDLYVPSNGLLACLDAVEKASGWRERRGKLPRGRGLGVAASMYISGTAYPIYPNDMPQSAVQVLADRSGRLTVLTGASDIGQGSDAMFATVISEQTGVPVEHIRVTSADTELTPVDLGAYSSRITMMGGLAAMEAGAKLREAMRAALAEHWGVPPERVVVGYGAWHDAEDPARSLPTDAILRLAEARSGTLSAAGGYRTRKLGGRYRGGSIGASPAYSTTAHVVEVSVDEETGFVDVERVWVAHDCGRAINPVVVEGQIEGSAYMGFAEAMLEAQVFDERGLHRGPDLLDYRIPTSLDTPEILAHIVESVDPVGPFGAKEAGEGPLHPVIPAIANAIFDAVGVRLRRIPFTPERVLAALDAAR